MNLKKLTFTKQDLMDLEDAQGNLVHIPEALERITNELRKQMPTVKGVDVHLSDGSTRTFKLKDTPHDVLEALEIWAWGDFHKEV